MRKLFLSIICLASFCSLLAQNDNYVILLDCTRSMNHPSGVYTPVHNDTAREDEPLWNNAKKTVASLFDHANDGDLINILLFQEEVQEIISGVKDGNKLRIGSELRSWDSIEDLSIEKAIEGTKNTCILSAWKKGEEIITMKSSQIDGYNKFFLITDGNEDHGRKDPLGIKATNHTTELCERIESFCDDHDKTVGYYSNIDILQEFYNNNNAIYEALRNSKCFHIVYAGRFDTKNVALVQEDLDKGYKDFIINFATIHSDSKPKTLKTITIDNVIVQSVSSSYFRAEILDSKIHNNQAILRVFYDSSYGLPELASDNTYSFDITITSAGKERIFDQHITATAYFELPKLAYLPDEIPQRLTAFYRKPFPIKWIANKMPRIAGEVDSSAIVMPFKNFLPQNTPVFFDREALRYNPTMTLSLTSSSKKKSLNYTLLANSSIVSDSFELRNNDDFSLILDFMPEDEVKKYRDKLCLSIIPQRTYGVDMINGEDYKEYTLYIPVEYVIKDAPLTIWLRLLGYILVAIACLVIFVSQLLRPSLRGTLKISVNGVSMAPQKFAFKPFNLGYKECVISSSPRKSSKLFGLFTGYTYCIASQNIATTIVIKPIRGGGLYVYDKFNKGQFYQIQHAQSVSIGNADIMYNERKY